MAIIQSTELLPGIAFKFIIIDLKCTNYKRRDFFVPNHTVGTNPIDATISVCFDCLKGLILQVNDIKASFFLLFFSFSFLLFFFFFFLLTGNTLIKS